MKLARLNHILIAPTRDGRERFRRSFAGRLLRPVAKLYEALSSEGRGLLMVMLFVGAAALEVATTKVYILWVALVGLLLGSLVLRLAFAFDKVRLEAKAPARVALGQTIILSLTLHNRSERDYHAIRLRGPFLPWDGSWEAPLPALQVLPAGKSVRLEARARFVHRGEHQLDLFSAAMVVPLGMAVGPTVSSDACRFIVVPRIAAVQRIALPIGTRYQPGGVAQASRVGEALELLGVRPYRPGDPLRDLHPRTWARTGKPHVRQYQQEFFTRIGVIVDNERSEASDEGFEAAVSLAAGVVACLSRGEALIDVLVVGAQIHTLTIGRSLGFFEQALDHLACAQLQDGAEVDELVHRLEPFLERLSAMVIISQSVDPSRLQLADAIERCGVACRILRVHDDSPLSWLRPGGSRQPLPPRDQREQVVAVSSITGGDNLEL